MQAKSERHVILRSTIVICKPKKIFSYFTKILNPPRPPNYPTYKTCVHNSPPPSEDAPIHGSRFLGVALVSITHISCVEPSLVA